MDGVFATAGDMDPSFIDYHTQRLRDVSSSQTARDQAKYDPWKTFMERNEIVEWARLRSNIEAYIPPLAVHLLAKRGSARS
jgi:hypothetical protein